ncbi:hypothetical protein EV401DRAFT_1891997 [Pisolithus croceorrhizus]|nr:hypothetical protein EV401DRAFT_1891997 [Pisolithus croceorrhizus]
MPEDFTSAIQDVGYDSLDDNTNNDGDVPHGANCGTSTRDVDPNLDRELDEMRGVIADPSPDASATELRQSITKGPLDAAITTLAKNPMRYQTPESKATANSAELYLMLPSELQAQGMKYEHFEQLVYTPLAPILFQDPSAMDVSGLFKNKVLTQIACMLHFGKGILTGKKKGGPPRRGQKLKTTMTTEGVIAICCTLARFLLSGDDEFSSTGSQTGILYKKDFEFYIELLRKQENKRWALGIFEHFDSAVFGANRCDGSQQPPSEVEGSAEPPRSWEDDMLLQLGSLGGTEGVNSDAFADPFTVQPIAHPPVVTSGTQSAASQTRTNSLSVTGAAWGGTLISSTVLPTTNIGISVPAFTPHVDGNSVAEAGTNSQVGLSVSMSPSQSVIVSVTGSELYLPLSDLSLGSSQPSISTHLNPPVPPVVVPALVQFLPTTINRRQPGILPMPFMLKDYETVAMIRCLTLCFALHSFEGVLAEKPTNIIALLGKAKLPTSPEVVPISIGLCLWAMDHKAKAKAAWQHSLEVNLSEWSAQLLLGLESINASKTGTKYIEAAFKANQKSPVVTNALCELFLRKSIEASRRTVQFADTLTSLTEGNLHATRVLHTEGSLMDATKYYTSATEGQPKHVLGAIGMAQIQMHNDEIPGAIHTLDMLIQPPNPQRSVEATVMLASLCVHPRPGVSSSDAAQEKVHACELFDCATKVLEHEDTHPNGNANVSTRAAAATADDLEMHLEVARLWQEEQPEQTARALHEAFRISEAMDPVLDYLRTNQGGMPHLFWWLPVLPSPSTLDWFCTILWYSQKHVYSLVSIVDSGRHPSLVFHRWYGDSTFSITYVLFGILWELNMDLKTLNDIETMVQ